MSPPPARFQRIAFLASGAPEAEKAREALVRRFNSDLANDLGNVLNRALPFIHRNLGGVMPGATMRA